MKLWFSAKYTARIQPVWSQERSFIPRSLGDLGMLWGVAEKLLLNILGYATSLSRLIGATAYVSRKNKRGRQMQINLLCLPLCFYAARGARLSLKFSLLTLKLFKSNFSAFSFKLFLDIFCNCFVSLFFDYLRSVVYNVFSFFKSKTC